MDNWYFSPGIMTTIVLILIVLIAAALVLIAQVSKYLDRMQKRAGEKKKIALNEHLINLEEAEVDQLLNRKVRIEIIRVGHIRNT